MTNPSERPRACPICGKPRSTEFTPFCSPRCRDRDLLRWLDEGYTIPGPPADRPDGDEDQS
jgi:endogenous inhibitor of DNA gyrase (YacG/DUF329 family)